VKLSEHFTLEEFTASETAMARRINNTPPPECVINLTKLAMALEEVRALLGHPIEITSAYRCLDLNAAVGGVPNSDHTRGLAGDLVCPGFGTPLEVAHAIEAAVAAGKLRVGQLIYEKPKDVPWVHFSIHPTALPQNRIITVDRYGTREGLHEARA
jgi:hypothetical protein